jgi:hypothetical protein
VNDLQRQAIPLVEKVGWHPIWTIDRFKENCDPRIGMLSRRGVAIQELNRMFPGQYLGRTVFPGNCLLNAGITQILNLLTSTGSPTVYSNGNAYLGVGDSTTAAVATQTALQASTNKTYVAMNGGYPSVSAQTATWQSTFTSGQAQYGWNEFGLFNAAAGGGTMLNRLVSAQGTKGAATWVLSLALTLQ